MKRIILVGVLILAAVTILAACGSQSQEQNENQSVQPEVQAPQAVEYTVEMSEYAFSPNSLTAKVGQQVTIHLINTGALEHEIMFGRDVVFSENVRPNGYEHDMFEEAGMEPEVMFMGPAAGEEMGEMEDEHTEDEEGHMDEHGGFMVVLPVGDETASLTFTVTDDMLGEWEMGCFLLDGVHYDSGMVGEFVVTN